MELSIIVVSHGHEADIPRCIESLRAHLHGVRHEVILVDNLANASFQREAGAEAAAAMIVQNAVPLGFAANVNVGAARATGRYLLLLNPDTEHVAGEMAGLLHWMDERPCVAILGAKLINADGSPQQSWRRFPTPLFLLLRGLGADSWRHQPAQYRQGLMDGQEIAEPMPVDWLFGAFMLVRRRCFDAIQGMDPGYRLYYEDVDFCYRMREAGYETWITPAAVVRHSHGRSSARRWFSRHRWWHMCSALRFFRIAGSIPGAPDRRPQASTTVRHDGNASEHGSRTSESACRSDACETRHRTGR